MSGPCETIRADDSCQQTEQGLCKQRVDQEYEQQRGAKKMQNASPSAGMLQDIVRPELIKGSVLFGHGPIITERTGRPRPVMQAGTPALRCGEMPAVNNKVKCLR
jgi:hypothetical protein